MKINWFTVIAQIINFLILLWLLKRFLYKPILNAIKERENKIAGQLEDAKEKKAEAKEAQDEFIKKNEEFDREKEELKNKAISETETERQKLMEEARNEAKELRSNMEKAIKETKQNLKREIAERARNEVFEMTRKTIADLASVSLDEQMTNRFIERLYQMNEEDKKQFREAYQPALGNILVSSAFELTEEQKAGIHKAVNDVLEADASIQFSTNPAQISGIELTSGGYKLAWSVSAYLKSLQQHSEEGGIVNSEIT